MTIVIKKLWKITLINAILETRSMSSRHVDFTKNKKFDCQNFVKLIIFFVHFSQFSSKKRLTKKIA